MFSASYSAAKSGEELLDPLIIRQMKPDVVIGHRGIRFEGDAASIRSPFHMKLERQSGPPLEIAANVNIKFIAERGTGRFGLPVKKWRIQSLEYVNDIPKPPHD